MVFPVDREPSWSKNKQVEPELAAVQEEQA